MTPTAATLVLEDGTTFRGESFGATGTAFGEVVFNTAMTGYQEILTDPSYHRQIVTMTYPHIGNYGVTEADEESDRVAVAALVVREAARMRSNPRATAGLDEYLAGHGIVGIDGLDTRRLVRHIRDEGAMRGVVSTEVHDVDELVRRVQDSPDMEGAELASEVTTPETHTVPAVGEQRFRVVAIDFGMKRNQTALLAAAGCHVTVVPASTGAEEVLAHEPDGVFLSNGPGDPAAVRHGIATIADLLPTRTPVFGICLGHQLLGRALGAETIKLPFGHHGANHPVRNDVRDLLEGGVEGVDPVPDADRATLRHLARTGEALEITSQNHGFAVDAATLPGTDGPFGRVVQTHVNLNDGVNEGLAALDLPAFSVQYHPESAPGPHDARYLFSQFASLMAAAQEGR